MEHSNILSILWQNKEKYGIIDEELSVENTFMQTSIGGDLWKAQLGMTENFIIFLKCYTNLILNNNSKNNLLPEEINILVNMVPRSHLKVRKYRKRTIEVFFPSGIVCYFKLLISDGCGKAWSRWKALEQVCDTDILPVVPVSTLIPFLKLNRILQKIIIADQFSRCFTNTVSQYSLETVNLAERIKTSDETKSRRIANEEQKHDVNLQSVDGTKKFQQRESTSNEKSLDANMKIWRGTSTFKMDKKKPRKRRQIRRFGEGVPENCIFDLTLSYSDELSVDNDGHKIDDDDDDDDSEKEEDVLHDMISLDERASRMIGRTLTDSSETEKTESVKAPSKEKLDDLEEQFLKIFGKSFKDLPKIEEEKPVKIPPNEKERNIKNGKMRNDHIKLKKFFNTAQFFTNVSSLVIPGGLSRSKSVDSIKQIQVTKCDKIFVTRNASLPDMNEMLFYQRHNRLNYSMDYFEGKTETLKSENHYFHPISFWLPDKTSSGRIYCTAPICRKISAEKVYSAKQKDPRMSLKRKKRLKTSVQTDTTYDEDKKSKNKQVRKHKRKSQKSANITVNKFQECQTEKELCAILKASPGHEEKAEEEMAPTVKPNVEKKTSSETDPPVLEPFRVAYELQVIQQRMFCEIESSEFMRFILKPHTVTEVTCPYLCGFLFFFERLKNLVVAELSAQKDVRETARKYELYGKIALACLKRKDEQSAYAIMSGLCNPKIFYNKDLWTYILNENEVINNLLNLFEMCYKRKKLSTIRKKIPFFLDFITFIVKNAIKVCKSSSRLSKESMWNSLSGSSSSTESNTRCKKVFSEFTVSSYGNYERIFEVIEESRNYFLFEEDYLKSDTITREYLLYKQF